MNRQQRRALSRKTQTLPPQENYLKVRAWDIPTYRQSVAMRNNCEKKVAFVTYGGLGDVLCAEPTIRYSCEVLKQALGLESISVITKYPDLFSHLPVETITPREDGKLEIDNGPEKYHFLYCGHPEGNIQHAFYTHNSMLPVDCPAISALRTQLPLKYRTLKCPTAPYNNEDAMSGVVVHAGSHWASKRFPKQWWDAVLDNMCYRGLAPILIGGEPSNNDTRPGTVDVNFSGCLDLRGQTTIPETAAILKRARVLITNDSFPLHLATIGKAHIGFLATAKDPEWLMHYREVPETRDIRFGWRMENLALGGSYQRSYTESNSANKLSQATDEEVLSWLPDPKTVAAWAEKFYLLDGTSRLAHSYEPDPEDEDLYENQDLKD